MTGLNTTTKSSNHLKVAKTIKLYIGGEYPRTESGRSMPILVKKTKGLYANVCKASRKDLRNAVTAAQAVQPGWQAKSAYNRGQILYRMAEMMEARRSEFIEVMVSTLGLTEKQADQQVDDSVDALVYYAGFSDKYQQVVGAVNPVSGPHHNFTSVESVGVVGFVQAKFSGLADFTAQIAAIIVSGNSVVALLATEASALLAPFSEVCGTSDLSKGVINILTGHFSELSKVFSQHMEVQSLFLSGANSKDLAEAGQEASQNLKRFVSEPRSLKDLNRILDFVEFKTVWHPIGH